HFSELAIVNPAQASPASASRLCASCHSLNEELVERLSSRDDPGWVRSPGTTLMWSRCFTESAGAFGCTTCHDAHRDAANSPLSYESKCRSCHDEPRTPRDVKSEPERPHLRACPVNPARDCIGCHMPRVRNPALHTWLTDHYIRVRTSPPRP